MTATPIKITPQTDRTTQRLNEMRKRLVIELGYLEHLLERGGSSPSIQQAAAAIDTAVDYLNHEDD